MYYDMFDKEIEIYCGSQSELDKYYAEVRDEHIGDYKYLRILEIKRIDGRILDAFRSSLNHSMVQALICASDWFRTYEEPMNVEAYVEEIEKTIAIYFILKN
ncbi:hypothetical protein RJ641_020518 [Dillenia turbinata]|uniref:Uncharacterized protein n=1 Tax=Dillenia turbinata TaxID=194707 RepID=A0AAN8UQ45_9MAGN